MLLLEGMICANFFGYSRESFPSGKQGFCRQFYRKCVVTHPDVVSLHSTRLDTFCFSVVFPGGRYGRGYLRCMQQEITYVLEV